MNNLKINLHPNDEKIHFNEKDQSYKIDGKSIQFSVSQIIDDFFPKFDSEYWSRVKAKERLDFLGKSYSIEKLNETQKKIIDEWELKRDEAAKKGTLLHEAIEEYYNRGELSDLIPEFKFFQEFLKKYPKIQPYRTEWRVFDSKNSIAGTIDMVYKKTDNEVFLFDWKRSKKIINSNGSVEKQNPFENGLKGLSHLSSTDYIKYCLQQNIYKYILEKNYGLIVSSMNLLILHPFYSKYHIVKVEDLPLETEYLINTLN